MSSSPLRSVIAVFLLVAGLALAPAAQARPISVQHGPAAALRADGGGFLGRLLSALFSLWEKEGSQTDPNGGGSGH